VPTTPPSQEEILRWRERLEDRNFQRHLIGFQEHIYRIFEDLRRQTGLSLIRAVIKRDEVKSFDSLVEKIRRRRERQKNSEIPFSFNDVDDLIGIKILCPYQNDVELVINYLYLQAGRPNGFRVKEKTRIQARRESEYGYRGFHFTAYPVVGARAEWTPLRCEIQIKTLIEEAWDAKTHDLSYKREGRIPGELHGRLREFSDFLYDAEKRGEKVRADIENLSSEAKEHRRLATIALFNNSIETLQKMAEECRQRKGRYSMPIIEAGKPLTLQEVIKINEALRYERSEGNIDVGKCRAAAYVALCPKFTARSARSRSEKSSVEFTDPGQVSLAFQLIEELAVHSHDDPLTERVRAQIYWAFSRFSEAIICAEQVIKMYEKRKPANLEKERVYSDFCYYIADAVFLDHFVPKEMIDFAQSTVQELKGAWEKNKGNVRLLGMADTIGFFTIVLGSDRKEVDEGVALVKEAQEFVRRQNDPRINSMAEAFCLRHLRLGEKRLMELR